MWKCFGMATQRTGIICVRVAMCGGAAPGFRMSGGTEILKSLGDGWYQGILSSSGRLPDAGWVRLASGPETR